MESVLDGNSRYDRERKLGHVLTTNEATRYSLVATRYPRHICCTSFCVHLPSPVQQRSQHTINSAKAGE